MATQTEADDSTEEKTAVELKREVRDDLLAEAHTPDEEAEAFLERALEEIVELLARNHYRAEHGMSNSKLLKSDVEAVAELLEDNVRDVDLRSNGKYAAPKVTVWLRDHPPMWANDATREEFKFSQHREHYNGKQAFAIIDVRPF